MSDVDVLRAVRATLADYLRAQLQADPLFADVQVLEEWPSARTDLPPRAITVHTPDIPAQVHMWPPRDYRVTPDAPGAFTGRVRYSYGRFRFFLQVDAWTTYPAARTALHAKVSGLLHRHPYATLPVQAHPWDAGVPVLGAGRWPSVTLLAGAPLLDTYITFRFDEGPAPQESGEAVQGGEARIAWAGDASGMLTNEETCAIMASLELETTGDDGSGAFTETITTPET